MAEFDMEEVKKKLEQIENKVDKIDQRLDGIDIKQAEMNKDLAYHVERTNLLQNELTPIRNKYLQLFGVLRFVGALITLCGFIEAILHLYLHF